MATILFNSTLAKDLGVTSCVINQRNQDTDTAVVQFAGSVPSLFAPGNNVTIYVDATRRFFGRCQFEKVAQSGGSLIREVTIEGPLAGLKVRSYVSTVSQPSWLGGGSFSFPYYDSRGLTVTAAVSAVLNSAISTGSFYGGVTLTIGTVSLPAITCTEEFTGHTFASVLRSLLAKVPQAIFWINYATAKLNVTLPSDSNPLTSASGIEVTKDFVPRDDLWLDYVAVRYYTTASYTVDHVGSASDPGYKAETDYGQKVYHVQTDQAGDPSGRIRLEIPVSLGSQSTKDMRYTWPTSSWKTLQTWANENSFRSIGQVLSNCGESTALIEQGSNWSRLAPNQNFGYCREVMLLEENSATQLSSSQWCPVESAIYTVPQEVWTTGYSPVFWKNARLRTGWSSSPSGGIEYYHFSKIKVVSTTRPSPFVHSIVSGDIAAASSGAANAIYGSRRTVYYQGAVKLPLDRWANNWAFSILGTASPVSQVTHNLAREQTDVTFGPPELIRPTDIAAGYVRKTVA